MPTASKATASEQTSGNVTVSSKAAVNQSDSSVQQTGSSVQQTGSSDSLASTKAISFSLPTRKSPILSTPVFGIPSSASGLKNSDASPASLQPYSGYLPDTTPSISDSKETSPPQIPTSGSSANQSSLDATYARLRSMVAMARQLHSASVNSKAEAVSDSIQQASPRVSPSMPFKERVQGTRSSLPSDNATISVDILHNSASTDLPATQKSPKNNNFQAKPADMPASIVEVHPKLNVPEIVANGGINISALVQSKETGQEGILQTKEIQMPAFTLSSERKAEKHKLSLELKNAEDLKNHLMSRLRSCDTEHRQSFSPTKILHYFQIYLRNHFYVSGD